MKMVNLRRPPVGVNLQGASYFGGMADVNDHVARVAAAGGGDVDEAELTQFAREVVAMDPAPSLAWAAACGYEAGSLFALDPQDGSGDLTVTSAGTTAFTQTEDGYWKPAAANEPRFTYTNGVRGLLVENAATRLNAFPFSIENAAWLADGITVDTNSGAGYDGVFVDANGINTKQGRKLVATANNGSVKLAAPVAVTAATSYVNSVYIKRLVGTGTIYLVDVNNTDRAVTVTSDWTRVQYAAAAAGTTGQIGIKLATAGDEVMVCYMPIEAGTVATSPIGGAEGATQTRNSDVVSKTGASALIGQTEGTVFVDFNYQTQTAERRIIALSAGTTANRIFIWTINNIVYWGLRNAAGILINTPVAARYKIALAYTGNNDGAGTVASSVNGSAVIETAITSGNYLISGNTINYITFKREALASTDFMPNMPINKALIFKSRLSNAQLQQLTTL